MFHAGGPHYAELVPEKLEFWAHRDRIASRKDTVKRILLAVPFVRPSEREARLVPAAGAAEGGPGRVVSAPEQPQAGGGERAAAVGGPRREWGTVSAGVLFVLGITQTAVLARLCRPPTSG